MSARQRFRWLVRRVREANRDNTWLVPLLGAVAGVLLAQLVGTGGGTEDKRWTITVDRGRDTLFGMLALLFTAISIVLALASVAAQNVVSRFGSRTLRVYLRVSPVRWLLGTFTLTSGFIIVEQFQMRNLDPEGPVPVASMVISLGLLIVTASLTISYIAVIIRWFRVDDAAAKLRTTNARAARAVVRRRQATATSVQMPSRPSTATDLRAPRSGYLAEIDADALLEACRPLDALAVVTAPVGAAVVEGDPIGWIAGRSSEIESLPERDIAGAIDVSTTRELAGYIEYSLIGMVDIAIIALSPAINNPNTAVEVINEMSFLFRRLPAAMLGPYAVPDTDSGPRVVVTARTFGELLDLATEQIVLYGVSDPMVHRALRSLAESLLRRDLEEGDRRHVERFAAKLAAEPPS